VSGCHICLRLRHAHHLIGDVIGFALVFVARFADAELWLDCPRVQKAVSRAVANCSLQALDWRSRAVRHARRQRGGRALRIRTLWCVEASRYRDTHVVYLMMFQFKSQ